MSDSRQAYRFHEAKKVHILGGVHFYGAACFFVFGVIYWLLVDSVYMFASNCAFGALSVANWLVYRRDGLEKWRVTTFLAIVYLGLVNVAVHLGVHDSPMLYWGLSVAVAAAFVYDTYGTLVWVGICLAYFPLCLFLKRTWLAHRAIPLDAYQSEVLNFASYTGILLFLGYCFFLFDGRLKRVIGELEASEAKAKKINLAKDVFFATLSHELRTPLTAIQTWAQLLKSGRLDQSKVQQGLDTIEKSTHTQVRIISDLLDVSRVISGKLRLEPQLLDPGELCREALESVRAQAQNRGLTIETHFESGLQRLRADPVRLKQIVWNLLSNAVRFSRDGGRVTFLIKKESDGCLIAVEDDGIGIPRELLERIFEPFTQADGSSVRRYGGLGLGLTIVKSLVELHGGKVVAESEGVNRGARFSVKLPWAPASGESAILPHKGVGVHRDDLKGTRVLLVEDDELSREGLLMALSSAGADVRAAASVSEALKALGIFSPDLLLSDIAMPGEDGYSLIAKIRNLPQFAGNKLPAIALTAFGGVEERRRITEAGFDLYLEKPVDYEVLLNAVSNCRNFRS